MHSIESFVMFSTVRDQTTHCSISLIDQLHRTMGEYLYLDVRQINKNMSERAKWYMLYINNALQSLRHARYQVYSVGLTDLSSQLFAQAQVLASSADDQLIEDRFFI